MAIFRIGNLVFEWDDEKAASNRLKHGVPFVEAASVFVDSHGVSQDDETHSDEEARLLLIGLSFERRIVTVVHVGRNGRQRIISARRSTQREKRDYGKAVMGRRFRDEG